MAMLRVEEPPMKTPMRFAIAAAASLVLAVPLAATAQAQIVTTELAFPKGASSVQVKGSIAGSQTRDYVVRASAGQLMKVTLKGAPIVYFNLLPPGSNDVAIFIGSTEGNSFSGTLAKSGPYKIRVYQMRSSARRGEKGAFTLDIAVTGDAIRSKGGLEDECHVRVAEVTKARVIGTNRIVGSEIYVNVEGAQAPWRCIISKQGTIERVEYSETEGYL